MAPQAGMDNSLPGVVEFVSYLGATIDMHVRISPKSASSCRSRIGRRRRARVGGRFTLPGRPTTASCFRRRDLIGQQRLSVEVANMKTATRSTSRRHVLKGAAALAATARRPADGAAAQAKGKIVIGTWGGDYARLLNKNIEQPILIKEAGRSSGPGRRSGAALQDAGRARLPRGTTDVQGLSALNMFQMHDAGVIDAIDYGKLKNAPTCWPR
jgi:hypothetical protein